MRIEWSTVVVVVALIAALVGLAALRVEPATLTAIGALAVIVAGALAQMVGKGEDSK